MAIARRGGSLLLLLLAYGASRLATLVLLFSFETLLFDDPVQWLYGVAEHGPARAFPEYPWPAVALLHLPVALGVPTVVHYAYSLGLLMLAADALFAWLLWRAGGRAFSPGLALWLLAFPAIGPLMVTRFDVLPAVLAGAGLIALARARPAGSGAYLALGCGLKVWPAFCVPALLVPGAARGRGQLLGAFAAVGVLLALVTAGAAGAERVWSPFASQAGRGLQLEAFAGLPLLWLRYVGNAPIELFSNPACNCREIQGFGAAEALLAATASAVVLAGALAWLHVRAFAAPAAARTAAVAALLAILVIVALIVTSRVFSPQYVIWLAAPMAALGVLGGLARADVALFIALCALTHLIFPAGYLALLLPAHPLHPAMLGVLTLRNILLVVLAIRLGARLWRATAPAGAAPAAA